MTVREGNWAAETANEHQHPQASGVPQRGRRQRQKTEAASWQEVAPVRHCGGPGALDKAHTPMNRLVPRPSRSTGPFLETSALDCKITLFQVFCKAPKEHKPNRHCPKATRCWPDKSHVPAGAGSGCMGKAVATNITEQLISLSLSTNSSLLPSKSGMLWSQHLTSVELRSSSSLSCLSELTGNRLG